MKSTPRIPRIRIAILTALGALASMAADCETVGTSQDRCAPTPDGYDVDLGLDHGEECNFAVDCNSGVCMPDGGDGAICVPWGVHETAYCDSTLGPGHVAIVLPSCSGGSQLTPTCVPENPEAERCDSHTCCEFEQACTRNTDCCSGWCYDEEGDGQGRCTDYAVDTCPGDYGEINFVDPVGLCLP